MKKPRTTHKNLSRMLGLFPLVLFLVFCCELFPRDNPLDAGGNNYVPPTPTPVPLASPSPTPDPGASPSPSPTAVPTGTPSPDPAVTPSPSPDPAATPAPTEAPTATPSPSPSPSPTSSPTPVPQYTVTFNSLGGSAVTAVTVDSGSLLTAPANPAKTNLSFGGWYKDYARTLAWNFATDTVNSAMTLYALWQGTVTFNPNGGSQTMAAQTIPEGASASLTANAFTLDGYVFASWNTLPAGTGTSIANGGSYNMTGNVTLYAQWTGASWARTMVSGTGGSVFQTLAGYPGGSGAVGAGTVQSTVSFSPGNSLLLTPLGTGNSAFLVRYDDAGLAQWVNLVNPALASATSNYHGLATDSSGNAYAAGSFAGATNYTFGNGVGYTVGVGNTFTMMVCYNSSGLAQWVKVNGGTQNASLLGAAADASGGVYGAGYQTGGGANTYSASLTPAFASGNNALLVKYGSSGTFVWEKTTVTASGVSMFNGVSAGGSVVHAAGYVQGTGWIGFGGSNINGGSTGYNALIVSWAQAGSWRWNDVATGGSGGSYFFNVATGSDGKAYAVGYQTGTETYYYGSTNSVAAASTSGTGLQALLVCYDSIGNAAWARPVRYGPGASAFMGVTLVGTDVYASGYQTGTSVYDYGLDGAGNAVTAQGTSTGSNPVVVKYAADGKPVWAKTLLAGAGDCMLREIATDGNGSLFAAGYQTGAGTYRFAPGVETTGPASGNNLSLVRYWP